jgi:hypothetical protein
MQLPSTSSWQRGAVVIDYLETAFRGAGFFDFADFSARWPSISHSSETSQISQNLGRSRTGIADFRPPTYFAYASRLMPSRRAIVS